MRNLLGFLINEKKAWPLPEPDGREFIVRRVDEGMKARLSVMDCEDDNVQKAANFPPWLTHVFGIMLLCGALLLGVAIELMGEEDMTYEIAVSYGFWWLIGFGAGLVLLSAIFFVLQHFRNKAVMNSSAVKEHEETYEKIKREALGSMLVPSDAQPLDAFSYIYRIKDGKEKGVLFAKCLGNLPFYAFRDGEALCLADVSYVLRIPYENIVSVSRVMKKVRFTGWNKREKFNKGAFKPFKIRTNDSGELVVKPYYRLEIRGSGAFELLFPPYEFETLASLLGYKAFSVIDVKN